MRGWFALDSRKEETTPFHFSGKLNLKNAYFVLDKMLSGRPGVKQNSFFSQSVLIDPVWPKAPQLDIRLHNTRLDVHLLEGPDYGYSTGEGQQ